MIKVLSWIVLSISVTSMSHAYASQFDCEATAFPLKGDYITVKQTNIPLLPVNKSTPDDGFKKTELNFTLAKDYQIDDKISVVTKFNPAQPLNRVFNAYIIQHSMIVYKLEDGHKRAVGADDRQWSNADVPLDPACSATVCAGAFADNVDTLTALANLPEEMSMYDANKKGLLADDVIGFFSIYCSWTK